MHLHNWWRHISEREEHTDSPCEAIVQYGSQQATVNDTFVPTNFGAEMDDPDGVFQVERREYQRWDGDPVTSQRRMFVSFQLRILMIALNTYLPGPLRVLPINECLPGLVAYVRASVKGPIGDEESMSLSDVPATSETTARPFRTCLTKIKLAS